jgi:hypothetical protein
MVFAGAAYYPSGGYNDIYAFTDTLENANNYYYESHVSGLHNCDLGATLWSEEPKYIGDGNNWAHIYCVKTKKIIKKTDYTNKREEYEILKKIRDLYRDDKKEYNKKIQEFISLNKKNYIIAYGELQYDIMYNLYIHKYIVKGLTRKQIKKKIWWAHKKK